MTHCITILGRLLPLVAVAVLLAGCQASSRLLRAQESYRMGNVALARQQIVELATDKSDKSRDAVLIALEQGSIERTVLNLQESNRALDMAAALIGRDDMRSRTSVSRETGAMLTHQGNLPYEATNYDRIMLHVYRSLNAMAVGDLDTARTALRSAFFEQRNAAERNARRIEKAQEEAREARTKGSDGVTYDTRQAMTDPRVAAALQGQYARLAEFAAYRDYANPFAEFLQGLYYLTSEVEPGDANQAVTSFERTLGMVPRNDYLRGDLDLAQRLSRGGAIEEPLTYVIFATGTAPKREAMRLDIPIFVLGGQIDYVGAAIPTLLFNEAYVRQLRVRTRQGVYPTELVSSMDAVVAREFQNELPAIVTKTLISTGIKVSLAYALNRATADDPYANLIARSAMVAYQVAQNQADLRTWATLPKQFQYARLPRPPSGELVLEAPGVPPVSVNLVDGLVTVVYARSIRPGMPMIVHQFALK